MTPDIVLRILVLVAVGVALYLLARRWMPETSEHNSPHYGSGDRRPELLAQYHDRTGDNEEIVTLATYDSLTEAEIAHTKLESAGIESFIAEEYTARMGRGIGIDGIRLQLKKADAERAWKVLAEGIPPEIEYGHHGERYRQPRCPHCSSLDISETGDNNGWKCEECGATWSHQHIE